MPEVVPLQPVESGDVGTARLVPDTILPHWGPVRRTVHRLCRRSRTFNTVVAALEMRAGREELLSLPQYMALCPTGQCNALCEFCSVTRNRTGIIKKQLPFDAIQRFTAPSANVVRMYGLEGNGEPTLYDRFDELAATLLRNGSTAYLITNGDRLTPPSIQRLIDRRLDAVNFSLNAATAATHRRVMKLRDFERVLDNIRSFVRMRGSREKPIVSISMVVTRDNVHQVVGFSRLGEHDLGVDRVLVRPLSEIATELSAVEDLRPLVPFESEITDMLDGVRDYLRLTPRRAQIEIVPDNFRAVRPDPPGVVVMPAGDEGRLLAPRPAFWTAAADASIEWAWNAMAIRRTGKGTARVTESAPIPVMPDAQLVFRCAVSAVSGVVRLCAGAVAGEPIVTATVRANQPIELTIPSGTHRALVLWLEADGDIEARLEFDRMRTPGAVRAERFVLPHSARWEVTSADATVEWSGSSVRVRGSVTAGPYLLKSYSAWCPAGTYLRLAPHVTVRRGAVGIGVLSADQQQWLATCRYDAGAPADATIAFETGANDRVHLVVYGAADGEIDAQIDWREAVEERPVRSAVTGPASARADAPPADRDIVVGDLALHASESAAMPQVSAPTASDVSGRRTFVTWIRHVIHGEVRYYCQKPWTDLHNFTVDGRMDVCCIATGESQARYALGNLMTQSFQEVWNGPRAREFRRTVNSGAPLPPCRRCPMSYAYQGPLFNPAGAERRVRKAIAAICQPLPFGATLGAYTSRIAVAVVSHVLFRGFRR